MKNIYAFVVCGSIMLFNVLISAQADKKIEPAQQNDLFLIDKIEAIIFGEESTEVITRSDVEKMSFEGKPRTLPDSVFERLVFMDAQKFKIGADPEAVDRYITMIMRENNLSQDDIIGMFRSAGYSYEEGRQQLSVMFAVNSMIDFRVKSRLIVPEAQIVAFYNEHPIVEEDAYRIQRIFIPGSENVSVQEIQTTVDRCLKMGKPIPGAQMSSAFWITRSEIAADKHFITTMKVGMLSKPQEVTGGFEMFKLLEKRPERVVPLESRYQEISDQLKRPLFEKVFGDYRKGLFDTASIVYY